MKSTPGYGDYHMLSRMENQQMKSMAPQGKGASKGGNHGMKTVKRIAGVKVNSK